MFTRNAAKRQLKQHGWSLRRAADFLECTPSHLSLVLDGHRKSVRLLARVAAMPVSQTPYRMSGFALKKFKRNAKKQLP